MRVYIYCFIFFTLATFPALGNLYSYPEDKRPTVSLADACKIAKHLLKARDDHKRYYITEVSLFGSREQDGWGAWNLWHYDKDGNKINVYIPFPTGHVGFHYYPHDYDKKGGDEEVDLEKSAEQILAEQDSAYQPPTASETKLEDKKKPKPDSKEGSQ